MRLTPGCCACATCSTKPLPTITIASMLLLFIIVSSLGNSARPSTGAGRRQCAGTADPPAFFMRYARSHLFSPIFDLETTRAGADGTQARAGLSHSKPP